MERIPEIRSVMTPFPYSIRGDATVAEARSMMEEHDIRHLPVRNGDELVGVISDRDIRTTLDPALGLPPSTDLLVHQVMVSPPYIVDVRESLDAVLLHLATGHLGCAVVVKGERLAGIFTSTDACRVYGEHLRSLRPPSGDEAA